jgi:tRNA(fMet)-specific endonuclease VapC
LAVLERFEKMPIGEAGISLITYGELEFGALKSQQSQKALAILDELVAYLPVLPMENEVATHYADIRANLEARGRPIGNNDLWIAAHARALDITLVSNNIKEFERVENLKLENWV